MRLDGRLVQLGTWKTERDAALKARYRSLWKTEALREKRA